MPEHLLLPDWPAPPNVHCLISTRRGGVSTGPYASLNLGLHVQDDPNRVLENRRRLGERLEGMQCQWIRQVHGTRVAEPAPESLDEVPEADALFTRLARRPCGILTADCLPVAFCDRTGREVAVAHAGWRGLCAGVLENTLSRFSAPREEILAWLGPAIGPCHFEVGEEVRRAFLDPAVNPAPPEEMEKAFRPGAPGKWMADLYAIAHARLRAAGVESVYGGGRCTFCEEKLFYSYRRQPLTGRFATVIYRS